MKQKGFQFSLALIQKNNVKDFTYVLDVTSEDLKTMSFGLATLVFEQLDPWLTFDASLLATPIIQKVRHIQIHQHIAASSI